jgi:hypothetical protein
MKNSIVILVILLTGLLLLARSAEAAVITFSAGDETVGTSSPVAVPITVSGFTDVVTFQFTLSWEPGVVQYLSVGNFGLSGLTAASFGTTQVDSGILTVSWDDATLLGQDLVTGSKLFDLNFITASSPGNTLVSFTGIPAGLEVSTIAGSNITAQTFNPIAGSVNVVPEPINIALGVFAGLFAGTTTLRWILKKRSAGPGV